jgi:hypothetical protein
MTLSPFASKPFSPSLLVSEEFTKVAFQPLSRSLLFGEEFTKVKSKSFSPSLVFARDISPETFYPSLLFSQDSSAFTPQPTGSTVDHSLFGILSAPVMIGLGVSAFLVIVIIAAVITARGDSPEVSEEEPETDTPEISVEPLMCTNYDGLKHLYDNVLFDEAGNGTGVYCIEGSFDRDSLDDDDE